VVVRCVGRDTVWLSVHSTLAAVGSEAALSVSRVVLVVVGVAVVWVAAVVGVLAVRLRLGSRGIGLLGLLLGLRLALLLRTLGLLLGLALGGALLLGLRGRVGGAVTAVLGVASAAAESGLVDTALGILAQAIRLGGVVATKAALRRRAFLLALPTVLLAVLLAVEVVGVAVLLVGGVVRGVVVGRRGVCASRLLSLRGLRRERVKGRLSRGSGLLSKRVQGLLRDVLGSGLAVAT
jgi:hypothetical protein